MSSKLFIIFLTFTSAYGRYYESSAELIVGDKPRTWKWNDFKAVGTEYPYTVIITEESKPHYRGCIGVPLSNQHVLASRSCDVNFRGDLLAVASQAVNWTQENSFHTIKNYIFRENIVLLILRERIKENIQTFSLPSTNMERGDSFFSFGWSSSCSDKIKPLTRTVWISCPRYCGISNNNLYACGQEPSKQIAKGSPIIDDLVIVGFTRSECTDPGLVDKVFPHSLEIKKDMTKFF